MRTKKQLLEDNFALAAGQCIVDDGLYGDDFGNQACLLQQRLRAVARVVEKMKADLAEIGGYENSFVAVPAGGIIDSINRLEVAMSLAAGASGL